MADSKVSALTDAGTLDGDEYLYVVDDPSGTPVSRRTTVATVAAAMVGARVYNTGNQEISNNTDTLVSWDAEDFDDDAMVDLGTSATDIVIGTAGRYLLTSAGLWGAADGGQRRSYLLVNSEVVCAGRDPSAGATIPLGQQTQAVLDLAVDDVVQLRVFQDSGGAVDWSFINGSAPGSTFLAVQQVA